jgi:hypothetical protein
MSADSHLLLVIVQSLEPATSVMPMELLQALADRLMVCLLQEQILPAALASHHRAS